MPRESLEVPAFQLEHLSILDEDGNLDADLEPDLDDERLLLMHRKMLLARRFDERMLSLQSQGRIGTFAPVSGQEAAQVGSASAIEAEDWVVPAYREIAVNAWRELPLEGMLLYNAGYNEGAHVPEPHRDLPNAVPVGTQMLHAAGLAYGLRRREPGRIVMTYFGDGATSEGDFHEAMNFAAVFACPVVFVCQNNQYAISVPRDEQTPSATLAQKAFAYDLPCLQVDGNDVLAVHVAAREAVQRAREEDLATMIECVTYRLEVHTTVDDPSKYRSEEEVEAWRARDPLPRFQGYLRDKGLLDDDGIESVEEEVAEEVDAAVERWEKEMAGLPGPSAMFDHVWAEPPPYLEAQREAFEREWRERGNDADGERGNDADGERGNDADDGTGDRGDETAVEDDRG